MTPFVAFESTYARLLRDHVDTDQIIPARFLKTTSRQGLGKHAFADWRYDPRGEVREDFELEQSEQRERGAAILLAGENFGCGSSREHAPWALLDMGFRAILARSFADIFRQNALKNGLLTVEIDDGTFAALRDAPAQARIRVKLDGIVLPSGEPIPFPLDRFRRTCLAQGLDEIDYVMLRASEIVAFERDTLRGN